MEKRWVKKEADPALVESLRESLGLKSAIVPRLLVQRGILSFDEAKSFFRPSLEHLHDPFLMKDMDKAVARLEEAIYNKERILIYGDYDVDGTTSVSVMITFLKSIYDQFDYYIPNRYKEGYGVSKEGVEFAAKNGFSLIVALDCGVKAVDMVDLACDHGIDFIICDHHRPGDTLPRAVALLDPKRDDCPYPFKELSGAAIGFKLCQAMAEKRNLPKECLWPLLDLVAVSIASDIVPIQGENRILSYFGLKQLSTQPRPGLATLLELGGLRPPVTISDIVFKVGPRINAAGRMNDARDAVRVLVGDAVGETIQHAEVLQQHNHDRRELDRNITAEALAMVEEYESDKLSSVVYDPQWHKGVIGIVASRLIEHFYRPTIVMTSKDGIISGSARSVKGFDIYEAIEACSEHLLQFGGHMYAAGLTLQEDKLEIFKASFERAVRQRITEEMRQPQIDFDEEIHLSKVTDNVYRLIRQFEPFGPGNPKPVFAARGLKAASEPRIVGEKHLKVALSQDGERCECIGFGMGEWAGKLIQNEVDAVFTINENEWRGRRTLQLQLKDLKFATDDS